MHRPVGRASITNRSGQNDLHLLHGTASMKATRGHMVRMIYMTLIIFGMTQPGGAEAGADQLEKILQEQTQAQQQLKAKHLKDRERIEQLKRDQQVNQAQQGLDQIKRRQADPPISGTPQAAQRQLDQLKTTQQLQSLQTGQQLNRIRRESDPLRQRQQINDLERRQRILSLKEQLQRNQRRVDMERFRRQQLNLR